MKTLLFCALFFFMISCQKIMNDEARLNSYEENNFFSDKSNMRLPIENTVSTDERGVSYEFKNGKTRAGHELQKIPLKLNKELLLRGQERFNIYCIVCHSPTGDGEGIVTQRGYPAVPTFHSDKLRRVSDGHIFEVISNGYGRMYRMKDRISARDRWAIVAYTRALQLSQNFKASQLHSGELQKIQPSKEATQP